MSLKEYNKKRDFDKTLEPKGEKVKTSFNRFVVQYHQARAKHYDLRLEHNGVLLSWAVPKGLSYNPNDKRLAVHVEDHPIDYINFEGIIPKGNYGAGSVEIFDKGQYIALEDMSKGLKKGHIKIFLNGKKLKGAWSLFKTDEKNWLAVKLNDEFVNKGSKKHSVKLPFVFSGVELATLTNQVPSGKNWIFEIKYDGYRIMAFKESLKLNLFTRNKMDYTDKFKSISKALKDIDAKSFVLDGEIVCFDELGRSNFGMLQQSIKQNNDNFHYVIFDLLALNGEDMRSLPLTERKAKLERLLYNANSCLIYSSHVENGKECFEFAKKHNLEGIIAKKKDSIYTHNRTEDWLKIKCFLRQEFVIAGYTRSSKNQLFASLLLGYYDNKDLVYVGKVGTGFSDKLKDELHNKFQDIIRKTSSFKRNIKEKNVVWLTPILVAEIQFAELTRDNLLRQASFVGLRQDKKAKDVKLEVAK